MASYIQGVTTPHHYERISSRDLGLKELRIFGTGVVGDRTTRYDPPRRARSTTTAGYVNEARRVYKVTVDNKAYNRPKPIGVLRPVSINRHV